MEEEEAEGDEGGWRRRSSMGVSEEQEPPEETQESSGRAEEELGRAVSFEGLDDVLLAGPEEETIPFISLGGEGTGEAFEEALRQPDDEGSVSERGSRM